MSPPDANINGPPSLPRLFVSFLRLGTTAFGGPAMVAYIRKMAVERNQWLDESTFQDGVALCQTIPGATAMQTAAYVGMRSRGVVGAAACFVGFGLPAFCFMTILSALYTRTHELSLVLAAFQGLRAMTVAIVANATFAFGRRSLKGPADILVAGLAAGLLAIRTNPILVILLAGLLGLLLCRGGTKSKPQLKETAKSQFGSRWHAAPLLVAAAAGFSLLYLTHRGLFDLGTLMFRIDLFAFGGGFASIPLMHHEIVDGRCWMDGATFMNGIALGQVTPGPIVITAVFVGCWLYGITGAFVATAGIFLPSFLMVIGVVPYFDRLRASDRFQRCMSGILASFVGLLLSVTIPFALDVPWDVARVLLASTALAVLLLGVDVLWVVLAGVIFSTMLV